MGQLHKIGSIDSSQSVVVGGLVIDPQPLCGEFEELITTNIIRILSIYQVVLIAIPAGNNIIIININIWLILCGGVDG